MSRFVNTLYNLDRAIASAFGAPPQETISSEVGRHAEANRWARLLRRLLDKIDPNHTEKAVHHANRLDKVDDGHEA